MIELTKYSGLPLEKSAPANRPRMAVALSSISHALDAWVFVFVEAFIWLYLVMMGSGVVFLIALR